MKDKSQVYLTIGGRQVDVKKGKFKLDRFNKGYLIDEKGVGTKTWIG